MIIAAFFICDCVICEVMSNWEACLVNGGGRYEGVGSVGEDQVARGRRIGSHGRECLLARGRVLGGHGEECLLARGRWVGG